MIPLIVEEAVTLLANGHGEHERSALEAKLLAIYVAGMKAGAAVTAAKMKADRRRGAKK